MGEVAVIGPFVGLGLGEQDSRGPAASILSGRSGFGCSECRRALGISGCKKITQMAPRDSVLLGALGLQVG